jgi:hypothetical protein
VAHYRRVHRHQGGTIISVVAVVIPSTPSPLRVQLATLQEPSLDLIARFITAKAA